MKSSKQVESNQHYRSFAKILLMIIALLKWCAAYFGSRSFQSRAEDNSSYDTSTEIGKSNHTFPATPHTYYCVVQE